MTLKLKIRQYLKMAAQNLFLPAVYLFYRRKRVQPDLVLLADAHHMQRPESMELLYHELLRRGMQVEEMYLDYQSAGTAAVLRHMTAFMRRYAQAGTVVICDNFLPAASCRKKPQTRLVQLWHACGALKKFGYDTTDDIPENYRGNVFRGTDLVTVSAPYCIEPFAGAMRLPASAVQPTGVSRSDLYFSAAWRRACRENFVRDFPEAALGRKKVVLWAPTFRGNPGAPEVIALDIEKLRAQLGEDYLVLSSLHPHMRPDKASAQASWSTQQLLPVTDILIADYSSLIFEYLLMEKPLVLYTPDYETYTRRRGFYLPYEEIPGEQVFYQEDLADAVRRANIEDAQEKRSAFLRRYMCACDGHATQRIADWICGKEEQL